jgi:adenylate cyclase
VQRNGSVASVERTMEFDLDGLVAAEAWRAALTGGRDWRRDRRLFKLIPASQRCKNCHAPLKGMGAPLMRLIGRGPYKRNPRFCEHCMEWCLTHPGGAEIDLSFLFVDVRGSTSLAERMSSSEFGGLMNRFYVVATRILIDTDAFIDKLVGDQVVGLYLPLFTGPNHAASAVDGAQRLLDAAAKWLPIGVGVHSGTAYVGTVTGAEGAVADVTALGDNVNIAARLASEARAGEALISESSSRAAGLRLDELELRTPALKGKSARVAARVLTAGHA